MIKKIIAMAIAVLMLSGCSTVNEFENNNSYTNEIESVSTTSTTSTTTEKVEEKEETSSPTTSTSETVEKNEDKEETSTTTSTSSQIVEEKPVSSTTSKKPETTSSTTTSSKPTSSTTSSKKSEPTTPVEKPVSSSTTTTSKKPEPTTSSSTTTSSKPTSSSKSSSSTTTSSKPVEKPTSSSSTTTSTKENTPTHNCDVDGHVWEEIYTKTEPKWHYEMHDVGDNGFDATLAKRYGLCTQANPMIELTHILMTPEMGAPYGLPMLLNSGDGSTKVRVWAIETYLTKKCIYCGDSIQYTSPYSFEQLGEWEQTPEAKLVDRECGYSETLWYDMYNIPQSVLDEIAENTRKILGM